MNYINFFDKLSGYSADWLDNFLNDADVTPEGDGDAVEVFIKNNHKSQYRCFTITGGDYDYAFSKIDKWTDTYRDITRGSNYTRSVTGQDLSFANLKTRLGNAGLNNIYFLIIQGEGILY